MTAGLLLLACAPLQAQAAQPLITLIIDDVGDRPAEGARAAALPGAVALAVLPGTPYGANLARAAHARGKEVLLHFPLEPGHGAKPHPLAVTTRNTRQELAEKLRTQLDALPFVSGVNIHQGSVLSQRRDYMNWMMAELRARAPLYFVDSYTSAASVALPVAENWAIPASRRQVFLDNVRTEADIRAQFLRLISLAQKNGSALGIGHPYPETLALLERELPALSRYQVRLVAPSELIRAQQGLRAPPRNRPVQLKLSQQIALATSTRAPPPPNLH